MMESAQSVLILFNLFGAGVGELLSTSLLSLRAIPRRPVQWMGVLLLCVSAAMMCISLEHAGYFRDLPVVFVEHLCGVAFGFVLARSAPKRAVPDRIHRRKV